MNDLTEDDKAVLVALHNGNEVDFQLSTGACPFSIHFAGTNIHHVLKKTSGALARIHPDARPYSSDVVRMPRVSDWVEFTVKETGDYAFRSPVMLKPEADAAVAEIAREFTARPLTNPEKTALMNADFTGISVLEGRGYFGVESYAAGDKTFRRAVVYGLFLRGLLAIDEKGRIGASATGRAWLAANASS
jgi:hypothetical protein